MRGIRFKIDLMGMTRNCKGEYGKRVVGNNIVWRYARWVVFGIVFAVSVARLPAQTPEVAARFTEATQAMRDGKLEEADAGFAAVIKLAPGFAEAYFNLGLVRQQEDRLDEAVQSLQKALALQPKLRGANLFLGITDFKLNHLDEAAAAVRRETVAYPKDANAWMWLGVVRLAQDRAEDAAEALDHADKLKPGDPDILYHRGRAHLLVSKDSYAEMFKADPQSWLVHRVLAQANAEADRHVDAIAEYEAAIKLAPTQPGLHEELGSEYRNANKIPEAKQAFQRELEIDPNNVLARYKLGAIAVEEGDGATGKQLMEAAQREKPGLVHMDYNLGRAEMLLGNDEAAANHFEITVKTDTTAEVVEQAWYQLGTIYRRERRMDEARSAMATFQKLKDEEADKSQQRMKKLVSPADNSSAAAPADTQSPQ
jgi:tetratricopeptide (TPR) repeat protein